MTDDEAKAILQATAPSLEFDAAIIVLAIVAPRVPAIGGLVIAVITVLRSRGAGTPRTAKAESA